MFRSLNKHVRQLSLLAVVCLMLSTIAFSTHMNREPDRGTLITQRLYSNEPINLTLQSGSGRNLPLNVNFSAGENWLDGLRVQVRNVSDKPISYIRVTLLMPNFLKSARASLFGIALQHGKAPRTMPPSGAPIRAIEPGGSVTLEYSTQQYAMLKEMMANNGAGSFIPSIKLEEFVIFSDNTAWRGGYIFIPAKDESWAIDYKKSDASRTNSLRAGSGTLTRRTGSAFDLMPVAFTSSPNPQPPPCSWALKSFQVERDCAFGDLCQSAFFEDTFKSSSQPYCNISSHEIQCCYTTYIEHDADFDCF
jgi:hypothetical protein